jgi:hypothetical protein
MSVVDELGQPDQQALCNHHGASELSLDSRGENLHLQPVIELADLELDACCLGTTTNTTRELQVREADPSINDEDGRTTRTKEVNTPVY